MCVHAHVGKYKKENEKSVCVSTHVALSNRLIQCSGSTLSPLPPLPGTIVAMEKEPNILKPEHTSIVEAARDQIEADLTRHRQ